MCGIVGYIGKRQAAPLLLDGLKRLEYRGYDSAGIAVRSGGDIAVVKAKGRLSALSEKTDALSLSGTCGIGHTRWATHGEPSEENAHPHTSPDGSVVLVHNGILENHAELREELLSRGYSFRSQTDTEVIVHLIDYYLKTCHKGPLDAIARFMKIARGSYAIAVLFRDYPQEIFAARKDSPMIVGKGEGEYLLASDVPAILSVTRTVWYMDNLQLARIGADGVSFFDEDLRPVEKKACTVALDERAAEKGGYEHFMLKEMLEQPRAVEETIRAHLLDKLPRSVEEAEEIVFVACGSAYHVGVTLQYVIEALARIPVRVELASEFRYRDPILQKRTLVVAISQSGETADTLAAVREAKARGAKTLAIVNVLGSSIAREADDVLYTFAGPEIAVATTKAYSAQLALGYLLAVRLGEKHGLQKERAGSLLAALQTLPLQIEDVLSRREEIKALSGKYEAVHDVFMIGRGVDYSVCLEGALKLKEICYVHTEAYAAGELKHGTISLIEEGTLVVGALTQGHILEKTASNVEEVRTRGASVLTVGFSKACEGDFFSLPKTEDVFAASLAVLPLQLFAYYMSVRRGLDVDKPRNLAKSVTVE